MDAGSSATLRDAGGPSGATARGIEPSRWTKAAISAFIVLTLAATIQCNRPQFLADWFSQFTSRFFSPINACRVRLVPKALRAWAYALGLNSKWQMYASLDRCELLLVPVGIDAKGNEFNLPEPLNAPRTFWQRRFTDFREVNFQFNILCGKFEQARYANYLLRHYPDHDGIPTRKIRLDLHYRFFIERPEEALAKGTHFQPDHWMISQLTYTPGEPEPW